MFYHYTTIPAFKSILKEADTKARMCFWATRYDCFADKEEVKLGVETIHRLMPEVEKNVQSDRQISSVFEECHKGQQEPWICICRIFHFTPK